MRRVSFIWLPYWPTDRLRRRGGGPPREQPFALTASGAGGVRLAAVDAAAAGLGLAPGRLLADARALAPALACLEHDPGADAAGLVRLARWCGRFSPLTAPSQSRHGAQADGLFLEVDGVAHLFGGEAAWLDALLAALRKLGFEARGALADTPGAAWALARFAPAAADALSPGCAPERSALRCPSGVLAAPGAGLAPLAALPCEALRLAPRLAEALRAVGLKRVGDLARAPRPGLARRFGQGLLDALDAAEGRLAEPIDALAPAARFVAEARFAEPLTLEGVQAVAGDLAKRLCRRLGAAGRGGRRFLLILRRVDGEGAEIRLGAARPLQAPDGLARLLTQRLQALGEGLDCGFGVEAMRLAALETERLEPTAMTLDVDSARVDAAGAAADLGDRLAARLGEAAISRLSPCASHLPERSDARVPRDAALALGAFAARSDRPLFLFASPEPIEAVAEVPDGPPRRFRWRRVLHHVARAEGPERIAAEWWRAQGPTRDYYRVETAEGRRFWLCRAGLYEGEAAGLFEGAPAPRWFVHGSFG